MGPTKRGASAVTVEKKQKTIASFFQKSAPSDSTSSKGCVNLTTLPIQKKQHVENDSKHVTSSIGFVQHTKHISDTDVVIIPDTQLSDVEITPNKSIQRRAGNDDITSATPDIIPVTPENEMCAADAKRKRVFGRSFLTARNAVASKPCVKMKAEKNSKEKLSKTRKSLISLTVNFNNNGMNMVDDSRNVEENKNPCEDMGTNACTVKVTPTKVYDGISIKRMAKQGTSPDSKRLSEEHNTADSKNDYCSGEFTETNHDDGDANGTKPKVKRVLSLSETLKKKQMDRENLSDICNYQLEMQRPKKSVQKTTLDPSTESDEILSDILMELTPIASKSNNNQQKLFAKSKKKTLSIPYSDKTKISNNSIEKALSEDLSLDEKKFLDEIKIDIDRDSADKRPIHFQSGILQTDVAHSMPESDMIKVREHDSKDKNGSSADLRISKKQGKMDSSHFTKIISGVEHESIHLEKVNHNEKETVACTDFVQSNYKTPTKMTSQELCDELLMLSPFEASFEEKSDEVSSRSVQEPPSVMFGRHTVTDVSFCREKQDLWLALVACHGEIKRKCILRNFWADTHVIVGDIVHIIGQFDQEGICCIDDHNGLIIVNPDLLLSGTTVVSSVFCMRKSVLNERFKGLDAGNIHMLYGSIIHSVFQQVLKKGLTDSASIKKEAEESIKNLKFLHDMYNNGVDEGIVMEEIEKYVPQLLSWIERYMYTDVKKAGHHQTSSKLQDMSVMKIHDIEENIWSPRFGIKGKIDLTVEVRIQKSHKTWQNTVLPLELKTGKPTFSVEHKGQVTLYSMMTSDRREDPEQGLLLYLRDPEMKIIPANHNNKRGLVQLRNEMAHYLSGKIEKTGEGEEEKYVHPNLPEPINHQRACSKCPHLLSCALYQKSLENRRLNQTMSNLVPETLKHLAAPDWGYFSQWCLMLELENMASSRGNKLKDIWCKTSMDREKEGKGIGGLVVSKLDPVEKISSDLCVIKFCRHDKCSRHGFLSTLGLSADEMVVLSGERPVVIALCTAIISRVTETTLDLIVESDSLPRLTTSDLVLRVDKYEGYNTTGLLYTNLARLMSDDGHSQKLRDLIINRTKPRFANTMSKGCIEKVKHIFKPLNKPQKTAILKVLMSQDYVLIRGYPGTGKTSTIVALVRVLQTLGRTVLLTSYTHSAVDNILLKLKKEGLKFLRLGRLSRIHPDIREFSAEKRTLDCSSVSELREFYKSQTIVATSCLGTTHPVFNQRKFDVCIIDEASQIVQPACLGPLFSAGNFVLVGDPKQLPPVVQSKDARSLGMDVSLFAHLDGVGATYELNLQYRMNSAIMELSNVLSYGGALKCGMESIATAKLQTPNIESVTHISENHPWIDGVLSPDAQPALFLDTYQTPAPESRNSSGLVQNGGEARLVHIILKCLIKAGVSSKEVGVIAPYRNQVMLIKQLLHGNNKSEISQVEVNTVDQYQGRDKSVIIISLVRSSREINNKEEELLKDIRRLNVAITRAKHKLILLGDRQTLTQYSPLKTIISTLDKKQAIISLPELAEIVKLEMTIGT